MVDPGAPKPLTKAQVRVDFRLLGPVEVHLGGEPVKLGGPLQLALLARLSLDAGRVVSRERLIDDLWEDDPPPRAARAVETKISRLRQSLAGAATIEARSGGYAIVIAPGALDADRFGALMLEADALRAGDPAAALAHLKRALALWRGTALGGVPEHLLRADRARLDDQRLQALEVENDLRLELGEDRSLVGDLTALREQHPLRERFAEQLMLALYRAGRQSEALEAYRVTARLLRDELGLDPGPRLRELEQAILVHDPSLGTPSARRRLPRRARAPVAIAAGLMLAAVVMAALPRDQEERAAKPLPLGVVLFDSRRGEVRAAAQVGDSLGYTQLGLGAAWSLGENGVVSQVDLRTGKLIRTVPVGVQGFLGIGTDRVWVTDIHSQTLQRIDPLTGTVDLRTRLPTDGLRRPSGNGGILTYEGSLWIARGGEAVDRLDPTTLRLQRRIRVRVGSCGIPQCALAAGDGRVWLAGGEVDSVAAIDARTNRVTARVRVGEYPCCIAVGGGAAWVVDGNQIVQLSPSGRVQRRIAVGAEGIGNVSYAKPYVWAAADTSGELVRVDSRSGEVSTFKVGNVLTSVAASGGTVAVSAQEPAGDVTAGLGPKVLRVGLPTDWLNSTDPAMVRDPDGNGRWQWQLHGATCAGLYRREPGGVVRELAGVVSRSSDALTWRIPVVRRLRFSPPVDRPVTADDVRSTLVRALSPQLRARTPAALALRDVVGVPAYRSGRAPDVAGITVAGDTLIVRTTRPVHDLPRRLSLPHFCVLPAGMPAPPGGIPDPLPTAGPYYVSARGYRTVVRPNPGYRGPRPRRLDGMLFTLSVEPDRGEALVAKGELDLYGGGAGAIADRVRCRARRPGVPGLDLASLCR